MTTPDEVPWSLTFHDGCGNGYRFWREPGGTARFETSPVRRGQSSSGVYSGGEPRAGALPDADAAVLWEQAGRLAGDATLHAAAREMGTGSFRLVAAASEREFRVRRCPALDAFTDLAARLAGG